MAERSTSSRRRTRLAIPRRRTSPGAPPGTLVADPAAPPPAMHATLYGKEQLHEREISDVAEIPALIGKHPVVWVDVQGLGDIEIVRRLGEALGLHPLALEDVVNVHQRPKVDEYDDHLFIACRMPGSDVGAGSEQVSLFLGENYVITFQERPGDCFDPVRRRIRRSGSQVRAAGADYLAYALVDAVTDAYFPLLERYGELVEELEQSVLSAGSRTPVIDRVHDMKRELLSVRRAVWPLRDMFSVLVREESPFVGGKTRIYFRDCYDHTIQLMDVIETYREIVSGLVDIHLSSVTARTNEIMKVLTMMATIFIPLGFIASVYGMNFDPEVSPWNMPELGWKYGYPFALGLMAAVALVLLRYFWRKGWLGAADELHRARTR